MFNFNYSEIWNKFLEFESHIGDLSSVIKVEKRRAQAIERISKSTSETAWLVDRYKFNDLLPCGSTELRCIGYSVKSQQQQGSSSYSLSISNSINNINNGSSLTNSGLSTFPKPDFTQMLPFKPKLNPCKY